MRLPAPGRRRFVKGDVVRAHFAEGQWYHAEVEEDLGSGLYAVAWFDGDTSRRRKRADELRLLRFCPGLSCYEEVEDEEEPASALLEEAERSWNSDPEAAAEAGHGEPGAEEGRLQEPASALLEGAERSWSSALEAAAKADEGELGAGEGSLKAAEPAPEEPSPLRLRVVGLGGEICEVAAVSSWTVADVKAAIEFETETVPSLQRLFVGASELRSAELLEVRFPAGGCVELTLVRVPRAPDCAQWLERVEVDGRELRHAPESIREDREVVLAAVSEHGRALEFACAELRADLEVVLAAVKADGAAVEFAAPGLRLDQRVVAASRAKADEWLQRVKRDGMRLGEAPMAFRADRRVVQAAVSNAGRALRFAAPALQADRWLVLSAVRACGQALQHASRQLRGDSKVVLAAIAQNPYALEFASEKLRGDRSVVLQAVRKEPATLLYATERVKNDREVVLEAVRRDGLALAHADERLQGDREIVVAAARQNSLSVRFTTEELRTSTEVLRAVRGEGASIDTRAYKPPGTPSALQPGSCPFEGVAWVIRAAMPGWDAYAVDFTVRSLARAHIVGVQSLAMAMWPGSGGTGQVEVNRRLADLGLPVLAEETLSAIRQQCRELPQPAVNPRGRV